MVQFYYLLKVPGLKNRRLLKSYLADIIRLEKKKLSELKVIFCSDTFLLKINRQFLGHDYYTDIITFEMSESRGIIDGEIYISIERVRENALLLKTSQREELLRVIFHGVLHLCGYKDKLKQDQKSIRAKEAFYLKRYCH